MIATAGAFALSQTAAIASDVVWGSTTSNNWTYAKNWSTGHAPAAEDVVVFSGDSETWAGPSGGQTLPAGAILVNKERVKPTIIQPFKQAGSPSLLTLHGIKEEAQGTGETLLISNQSKEPLTITSRSKQLSLEIELLASGVIDAAGPVAIGSPIRGQEALIKRGEGSLTLGDAFTETEAGDGIAGNTFTGGFTLEQGDLATFRSSSYKKNQLVSSPFGLGTLTLKGGSLHSTSGRPRFFLNSVDMQGTVSFPDGGPIHFGSRTGGTMSFKGDTTVVVANMGTYFEQPAEGDYAFIKDGKGTLNIAGDMKVKELIVKNGGLRVTGSLTCEKLEIGPEGSLSGLGKINCPNVINPTGVYESEFNFNHLGNEIAALVYRPKSYKTGDPVIILFHGASHDANGYRKSGSFLADKLGMLLVVPEFDRTRFDSEAFQEGGVMKNGAPNTVENMTFSYVAPLVQEIFRREGKVLPYYLIGHSGGAQFVDRMAAFDAEHPQRIVSVNAGSLVFPTKDQKYPYGFGGLPENLGNDEAIKNYLAAPLTLYLGTGDVLTAALPVSGEAMVQGATRIERGRNCYEMGKNLAKSKGWPFNWKIVEADGLGHGSLAMWKHPNAEEAILGK